jgi:imidazolonepropionase-like amidohydrolase
MKPSIRYLAAALALACVVPLGAQNLVIVNARILDGNGGIIERGTVTVEGGNIAAVASGAPAARRDARVIDAAGKTVMPGFI